MTTKEADVENFSLEQFEGLSQSLTKLSVNQPLCQEVKNMLRVHS